MKWRRFDNTGYPKEAETITTKDLGILPIPTLLRHYAVPSLVGSIVNSLYNIVDRIFIGQGVSSLAISGLAVTFPILIFLQAFGVLIGAGASSRISILLGQKRNDDAEHLLGNAFVLTITSSLVLIVLMLFFLDDMLVAFGASEATLPYAKEYMQIVIPGNIFANLTFSYSSIMRSTGYPRKAMNAMLIGAGINIVLDPLFIFVFRMGIAGVAWATVISMLISAIYVMRHYMDKNSLLRIKAINFKLRKSHIINILSIGIAPFTVFMTGSVVTLVKNTSLILYGGDFAVGAFGIVNSIATLVIMTMMGFTTAMQPIIGYNFGAGNMTRVHTTYLTTRKINMIIGLVGTLLAIFMPRILAMMFTHDPELLDVSVNALRIELLALWAVGFQVTTGQFFQSIGAAWRALIISFSRQVIYLIPLIYLLPRIGMGLNGVWAAAPISDIMALVTSAIIFGLYQKNLENNESVSPDHYQIKNQ